MNIAVARVVESGLPLVYVNQVGGQDELVFDGASFVLNADKSLAVQLPAWEETLALTEWQQDATAAGAASRASARVIEHGDAAAYQACVLGVRDYVEKNGFPGVILGLSGGIDSALVAAIAVDALGPQRVRAVMMPYRFTSDATASATPTPAPRRWASHYQTLPIEEAVRGLRQGARAGAGRHAARHHRGEHPGARPRHHPDGAVQQVRRHGASPPATSRRCRSATPRSTAT